VTKEGDSVKVTEIAEDLPEEENNLESSDESTDEEPQVPAISEEELNAIIETARKEGHDSGYSEGFEKGYREGFEEGGKEGLKKGEEAGHEEGLNKGYEEGLNKGHEEGLKKASQQSEQLEMLLNAMNSAYSDLLKKNETFIIDLVCRAVEKIVYGLMIIDHNMVKRAVMEAFSLIPEPEDVTVRINTEDYEFIEHVKDDFFRNISSLKQITVIADPGVPKGGCQVECAAGEVEMDIENRLETIKKKLIELS
jgi:flagellar assembly protein FliH